MLVATAAIAIFFSANAALAQSGGGGGSPATLERLGCGPGHVPRVNAAGEWECSVDLTDAEAAAAAAQSTADDAVIDTGAAQSTADGAETDAAAAQSTADGAASAAAAAQSTATDADNRVGVLEGQDLDNRLTILEGGVVSVLVDCATDTIADALAAGATDITVRGLCDENLDIRVSNVAITGENLNAGAPVDGIATVVGPSYGLRVRGAQNVSLIDLKVTGGRNGVEISRGGAAFIDNGEIAPASTAFNRLGVFVGDGGFVHLFESNIIEGGILEHIRFRRNILH